MSWSGVAMESACVWIVSATLATGAGGPSGVPAGASGVTRAFGNADWAVLLGYFVLLALTGWWFSRRELSGAKEYFLAGRSMPVWAVAISVLATSTSAATFIGGPEEGYARNLTYLSTNIGMLLAIATVAVFFIPAFYKHNCTTVYDLLEIRLGHGAKQVSSWAFMIGRVFASGSRLYMAGIPLSLILFRDVEPWQLVIAIAALTVVGILYTLAGGIRSIIWTDVIQFIVFVGAAVAALVMLLQRIPAPVAEIYEALAGTRVGADSKLTIVTLGLDSSRPNWGFDPTQSYTLLTAIFGFTLLGIASYGTDHDLAQRMLTCRSAFKGSSSAVIAIVLNLPVALLFTGLGLLLFIFYQRPDLMGAEGPTMAPDGTRQVFLAFILNEMPPGMTGLMMAGLFAAGLGSFNSALNAMGAAFINDVYQPLFKGRSDTHYLSMGRWAVVGWGVILGAFAMVCIIWQQSSGQTLIEFALGVMTFAYAGLLGVFLTAIFTKRGNSASAIGAIVAGFVIVAGLQSWSFPVWAKYIPLTWTKADGSVTTTMADLRPAFPWVLLIAASISTALCAAGKPTGKEHQRTGL